MDSTTGKRKREPKKVPTTVLQKFLDDFGFEPSHVDQALGMSKGYFARCLQRGLMPMWVNTAIEGLARRQAADNRSILIVTPGTKLDSVVTVLKAMNITHHRID